MTKTFNGTEDVQEILRKIGTCDICEALEERNMIVFNKDDKELMAEYLEAFGYEVRKKTE